VSVVGLSSAGRRDDALAVLKNSLRAHPEDVDLLSAALNFSRAKGDVVAALDYAERMTRLRPDDPHLGNLVKELKR
jgi:Flp pilus assembly protein TadD